MLNSNAIKTITNIIKGITSVQQLHFNYWFRNPGPAGFKDVLPPLVFFVLIIIAGIAMLVYNRWRVGRYPPKNRIFTPAGVGLIILGISGVAFTLMRSQGITFLGVRFFLLAHLIAVAALFLYFLYQYKKRLPSEAVKYEADALKRKYLSHR